MASDEVAATTTGIRDAAANRPGAPVYTYAQIDRWLARVRAEAAADALVEASHAGWVPLGGRVSAWLRARAADLREKAGHD